MNFSRIDPDRTQSFERDGTESEQVEEGDFVAGLKVKEGNQSGQRGWEILEPPPASASANMACDRALLDSLRTHPRPILHLYQWAYPAATYGHFIDPTEYLDLKNSSLDLARRSTGGGIVFHTCDLAFSILLPITYSRLGNTLANYHLVNRWVQRALEEALSLSGITLAPQERRYEKTRPFCMAHPTVYDLLMDEKKIAGAAQRRTKAGLLHQGTISLMPPDKKDLALLKDSQLSEAIQQQTAFLIDHPDELEPMRARLRRRLKQVIMAEL